MKRLASSIILCSLLLFCACESAIKDNDIDNDERLLVNLDVSVALSDVSDALTRAGGDAGAANDNEKMKTLRIVIVRPNWMVEANRFIDLNKAASLKYELERFRVVGNEWKRIYLFVNENSTILNQSTNQLRKLVDFDMAHGIQEGGYFPVNDIDMLKIRLEDKTEQIDGPLPMSEKHEVFVNKDPEQSCTLFVTRAAVKFTFHIKNLSSNSITLDKLTIDKMACEEWYMPRVTYAEPNEQGQREITDYDVPNGVGYYTYTTSVQNNNVAGKEETDLPPIYLLEGKYTEDQANKGHNYSIDISINGIEKKHYLPKLESLPRNTHVVVNITCDVDAKVTCDVDVIPYSEVELEPGFGL